MKPMSDDELSAIEDRCKAAKAGKPVSRAVMISDDIPALLAEVGRLRELVDAVQLLTVEDLISILKLSRGTVYGLLKSNEIKSMKIGKSRRISRGALDSFLNRKGVE